MKLHGSAGTSPGNPSILLLAVLLLPALGAARERARCVVDISNLRQFLLSCFAYAGDNNRELPYGRRGYFPTDIYRLYFPLATWQVLTNSYGLKVTTAYCNHYIVRPGHQ